MDDRFECALCRKHPQLNDLRDWREHYLRQQKLQQSHSPSTADIRESSQEHKVSEDIADNVSQSSSASGSTHTASSRASSRNSITIKNKMKIMRKKSVSALSNVNLPSFHNLLSVEMGADDEKIAPNPPSHSVMATPSEDAMASTKEHDEVIAALSGRLAIVKENYMNLKQVVSGKDTEIESLQFELTKKKEMIADLIDKLMDKPLPPTPSEMHELEQVVPPQPDGTVSVGDLETHRLSGPDAITMVVKPVLSGSGGARYRVEYKRPPASLPPPTPKVVVSPSYDKGVVFNSHYPFPAQCSETHLGVMSAGTGGTIGTPHHVQGHNIKNNEPAAGGGTVGDLEDADSDEGI